MKTLVVLLFALLFSALAAILACGSSGDDDDAGGGNGDADDDSSADDDDASPTELTWQEPPASDAMNWYDAIAYCDALVWDDYDDWRLPTISELRSFIRGCPTTELGGSCGVTDECADSTCRSDQCDGCPFFEGPGADGAYWPDGMSGQATWFWSSTVWADNEYFAWTIAFYVASVDHETVGYIGHSTRCVRP